MKRALSATCLVVLLAALPAAAQVDMSVYVALGDSLTAGYASGGLMDHYQERTYPALLARQAGTNFQMPLISAPGIPPLVELYGIAPDLLLAAPDVAFGVPVNAEYPAPYNNLGVPGAAVHDMIFTTGNIMNVLAGTSTAQTIYYDLILRDGQYSAMQQAIGLGPTFITVWIGANDVLSAAVAATPLEGITMTPVAMFQEEYAMALGGLAQNAPNADIVVINVPPVTVMPFVTTLDPYIDVPGLGHVPLIGSNGPLPEDALVTLGAAGLLAQGIGVPAELGGTGIPLPEDLDITTGTRGVVLRAEEVAVLNERVAEFNAIINATADALGIPVLDINGILSAIAAGELPIFGNIELSTDFLTGGIFSYDGIHPQTIGHGLVAMHLIDLINAHFGADIPQVDMAEVLCEECVVAKSRADLPVFTQEAFDQLKKVFPIKLPQSRQVSARRH